MEQLTELVGTVGKIFPVAEYAYTTIPTYPSGQIGFLVCSKQEGRNLREPLRTLEGTRYYNDKVHRAAFVLPEFGRQILKDRPRINSDTVDMNKLALLPEGTFGNAYVTWLERCGVTPDTREPVRCSLMLI